jgi:hypothetical protein
MAAPVAETIRTIFCLLQKSLQISTPNDEDGRNLFQKEILMLAMSGLFFPYCLRAKSDG